MKPLRFLVPLALAATPWCARAAAPFSPLPGMTLRVLDGSGVGEFDLGGQSGTLTGSRIEITYSNAVVRADQVTMPTFGEIHATGNVTAFHDGAAWYGEHIVWDARSMAFSAGSFKAGQDPVYIHGEGLRYDQATKTYVATNAVITTDNVSEPAHEMRAKVIRFVPGRYVEADGATLRLGPVPVFYLPHYIRSLTQRPFSFSFVPGYRSRHGAFLESTFFWDLGEAVEGGLRFDMRSKRGFAGGPEVNVDLGRWGQATFDYYFADDDRPGLDTRNLPIAEHRDRFKFTYDAMLMTNLTVKSQVRYQRDAFIVRDFFESEYRDNVQPSTFVEVNQSWPNWTLDAYVQPRVNDFFESVERLPDIRLTGLRQRIGETPFYYDSESSFAHLRKSFAHVGTNDYSASRADSFHQVTLPRTFFGWLNVTPRAGVRYTHYTEADGPGAVTGSEDRVVFNTGAEVSLRASRVWQGAANRLLDVRGLRHIVEPSVNYAFVPAPGRRQNELPQFDSELPSLRLLPIEYPGYNAIDSIDSQNVLRFGLRNKLQTKRDNGLENLVHWSLFTDWRLNPRQGQETLSDFFSDLDFQPRSWLTFNSMLRYNPEGGKVRESYHRVFLQPAERWSLTLGHRLFEDEATYGPDADHNVFFSSFYYKMNENWAFRTSHHFEARDGVMEEQFYTLYRDLRSWTAGLTLRMRDNRVGPEDYTIALTFSLKAAPRYAVGGDRDQPERLLGH